MSIGELVGRGRRCSVYTWGRDKVIKVFASGVPRAVVEREAELAVLIRKGGLPAAEVYGITEVDGLLGIVYQRLKGPTLTERLLSNPEEGALLGGKLGKLHASIHSRKIAGLPPQRTAIRRSIETAPLLTPDLRAAAMQALNRLPDGDAVCHMDLNTDNVILTEAGMMVIDWDNASLGNPLADVARTLLMIEAAFAHAKDPEQERLLSELMPVYRDAYLSSYLENRGGSERDVDAWTLPLAAARLREGITEESQWLMSLVKKRAEELLPWA